jgi:hypothetical protein
MFLNAPRRRLAWSDVCMVSVAILLLIGLVILGVAHLADVYKKNNALIALSITLVVFGFAFLAYVAYMDYAGQSVYSGDGIVLDVRPTENDNVFRHVVIEVPGLDDVAVLDLTELEYYESGQPAVGSVCMLVRRPYYMVFFTFFAYDISVCSAPVLVAE